MQQTQIKSKLIKPAQSNCENAFFWLAKNNNKKIFFSWISCSIKGQELILEYSAILAAARMCEFITIFCSLIKSCFPW